MTHSWQFPLIAAIFAAAVLTVNRGLPLPYALNICGGLIALTIGLSPNQFLDLAWEVLTQPAAIELLLSVFLIRWLGDIMDKSGNLARASRQLENLMGDRRLVSAVIPLITGLLMVPGGAILSAPAVQRLTDNMGLHPSRQAAINLIFRHIGQIVFPLSASFLVLTSTVGVSPVRQALYHLPIACAIGLFSFRFYFADVQRCPKSASSNPNKYAELKPLAVELSPVLVVVAVFALVHKIVLALGLGVLWAVWRNRLSIQDAFATFRFKETMDSALLIVGTLVIQGIFQGKMVPAADYTRFLDTSLASLIMCLLPAVIGFFTGSVVAGVSLSAPLLSPVLIAFPDKHLFCATVFMASFGGYLVSPVHLCLSLTAEYYGARLGEVYEDFWLPAGTFLLSAVVTSLLFII